MKKRLLLLVSLPLVARADPHFGPHFGLYLLLAAVWNFIGIPLLVAQVVGWVMRLIRRKKSATGAARVAAVLASWLGVYLVLHGSVGAPGDGLLGTGGSLYLAAFSGVGAVAAVLVASKQ